MVDKKQLYIPRTLLESSMILYLRYVKKNCRKNRIVEKANGPSFREPANSEAAIVLRPFLVTNSPPPPFPMSPTNRSEERTEEEEEGKYRKTQEVGREAG